MKKWMKITGILLVLALCLPMLMVSASADSGSLAVNEPTKEAISQKWSEVTTAEELYIEEPSVQAPYSTGVLSESFLNSGLTYLNYIRFVANLPAVQLSDSAVESAQYGATVLAANDTLSHYPDQPADMDDIFYQNGYNATTSSNLSYRSSGVTAESLQSSLQGCMEDSSSSSNLACVGHRRWLLNPTLLNVGFGCAESKSGGAYVATKVFDRSGPAVDYDYISWPASGNFPTNLFSTDAPWSITLNPGKYQYPSVEKVCITITRESDGKQWTFDRASVDSVPSDSAYIVVDTMGYGVSNCIIFRPGRESIEEYIGKFSVQVTGICLRDGTKTELSYKVEFFDVVGGDVSYDDTGISGSCGDDVQWRFDTSSRTLRISGNGEMTSAPWGGDLWEKICHVVIEEGVTSVADHAFDSCYYLESVLLPSTVERIGASAFYNCPITEITLPVNLHRIEDRAFMWTDLIVLTIPGNVTYIGDSAFARCYDLRHVWFTGDVPEFGADVLGWVDGHYPADNETWDPDALTSGKLPSVSWSSYVLEHFMDEGIVTKDPTEEHDGEIVYTCFHCGYILKEIIHYYTDETVDPTCTEQGYTGRLCTNCGDRQIDAYISPLGHAFGEWRQEKVPTCVEAGREVRTCERCGAPEEQSIAALGHSYESVAIEPTCTDQGCVIYNCKTCSDFYMDDYTDALGHDYRNGVCTNCGDRSAYLEAPEVKAANIAKTGKIKLSWSKVKGAVKYKVYRSTSKNSGYKLLITTSRTSIANNKTEAGETYYYYVVAVAADETVSEKSNTVTRVCDLAQPVVKLTNAAKTGKIRLSWEKVEGAVKYEVYRATSKNGKYTKLITTKSTSITNTSTTAGKTYYYKVKAICSDSAGNSALSGVKARMCDLQRPVAEVELNRKGKPVISWEKVSGAVKYRVYIYDAEGNQIKTVTTTKLSVTHSSAVKNRTYSYRVVASHSNSAANSAKSSTVKIKPR